MRALGKAPPSAARRHHPLVAVLPGLGNLRDSRDVLCERGPALLLTNSVGACRYRDGALRTLARTALLMTPRLASRPMTEAASTRWGTVRSKEGILILSDCPCWLNAVNAVAGGEDAVYLSPST